MKCYVFNENKENIGTFELTDENITDININDEAFMDILDELSYDDSTKYWTVSELTNGDESRFYDNDDNEYTVMGRSNVPVYSNGEISYFKGVSIKEFRDAYKRQKDFKRSVFENKGSNKVIFSKGLCYYRYNGAK